MTPERIKKLHYAGEGRHDDDIVIAADFSARLVDRLAWGELRALLDAHGKTCEWVEAVGCYDTTCGHSESGAGWADFCPHCGGRVVVRDGGTT